MVQDISKRFSELDLLEKGWLDGEGEPIPKLLLEKSKLIAEEASNITNFPEIFIYPTAWGDIRFEFDFPDWDLSIETRGTEEAFFHSFNFLNNISQSGTIDFEINSFVQKVQEYQTTKRKETK